MAKIVIEEELPYPTPLGETQWYVVRARLGFAHPTDDTDRLHKAAVQARSNREACFVYADEIKRQFGDEAWVVEVNSVGDESLYTVERDEETRNDPEWDAEAVADILRWNAESRELIRQAKERSK